MTPDPTPQERADDERRHAEDVAWIREVRQGRTDAFAHVVERYGPRLHAVLRRFFTDAGDLDDILQDALVRAYQNLDRYDASRALYPWLRKIAVNLALNELQKRKRRHEIADPEPALAQVADPAATDRAAREAETHRRVEAALAELPPDWAAVFRLRAFEEMGYAEIADALDVPIGTVMSRLSRARQRLAEALTDHFGPREGPS